MRNTNPYENKHLKYAKHESEIKTQFKKLKNFSDFQERSSDQQLRVLDTALPLKLIASIQCLILVSINYS